MKKIQEVLKSPKRILVFPFDLMTHYLRCLSLVSDLSESEVLELMNAYYSVCKWVPIYYLWRPNLKDENDNFLVELAIAGNSEVIITNNIKDLEGTELNFSDLKILKPEQLLRGH